MKGNTMTWFVKPTVLWILTISSALAAEFQTATLDVKNMQCQMCSITVKKALQKVPGVEDAKVDLDQKKATVKFAPDRTSPHALIAATTKAGFPATLHK